MSTTTSPFPLDKAQIISTWMGAVAFGECAVSFVNYLISQVE
jgi:hypothetical protein